MSIVKMLLAVVLKILRRVFLDPNLFPFGTESTGLQVAGCLISIFTLACMIMWVANNKTVRRSLAKMAPFIIFLVILANIIWLAPDLIDNTVSAIIGGWKYLIYFGLFISGVVYVWRTGVIKTLTNVLGYAWDGIKYLFDASKAQSEKMDEKDEKGKALIWFGAIVSVLTLNGFFHGLSSEKNSYLPSFAFVVVCVVYYMYWCWRLFTGRLPPEDGSDPDKEQKVAELTVDKNGWFKGFWVLLKRRFSRKSVTWQCECNRKHPLTKQKCADCKAENPNKGWKCKKCGNENWSTNELCDCDTPNPRLKTLPPRKERRTLSRSGKVESEVEDEIGDSDGIECWNCTRFVPVDHKRCICLVNPWNDSIEERALFH